MEEQLNLIDVSMVIEQEGFDICFEYYNWEDVKDSKFHHLRQAYLDAAAALKDYIQANAQDPLEDWFE